MASSAQMPRGRLGGQENRAQVDVHDAVEVVLGAVVERPAGQDPGVVPCDRPHRARSGSRLSENKLDLGPYFAKAAKG